jgi:hypothetical protein
MEVQKENGRERWWDIDIIERVRERDFDKLKREILIEWKEKTKRGWDYNIIERVKEWEIKAWGSVSGFKYVDRIYWMQV